MAKQMSVWALLALLLLATPMRAQDAAAKKQPPQGTATSAAAPDPNYVIGPQDVLDINVWKEAELTRSVPVRPDGKISLPLLNDVQAGGLTPLQLAEQITTSLKKFITDPQVTVIVAQTNSQRVYILGEAARPGLIRFCQA